MQPTVPKTYQDALRTIVDRETMKTKRYRDLQWHANRIELDPHLLLFERLLVRRLGNIGVPMFTTEAHRTATRQAELFEAGFSRLKRQGPHLVGMAVDIVHVVKLWELAGLDKHGKSNHAANKLCWDLIGHVGKEIIAQERLSITWGGDWRSPWDPAHWERTNWSQLPFPAPF